MNPRGTWRDAALAVALAALCGTVAAQPAESVMPTDADAHVVAGDPPPSAAQLADPWEGFNRAMFRFNQDLDDGLLHPWASAYVALVPQLLRTGVSNVFNNFQDAWSAVNNLLQGKLEQSTVMTMRFAWNSTFGLGGILDMATEFGMERTSEDFGQTLGVWGMQPGPYLVLPFFGPSTVRDAIGLPLDIAATPAWAINQGSFRPVTTLLQILDTRAELLGATQLLDTMALDKYSFVRSAYLARRKSLVFDGDPPEDDDPGEPVPVQPKPAKP